jgi:hypothetical protein
MTAFAGFDSSAYPGDSIMKWLRTNTNLVWCGYYFGKTPSHTGTDLQGLNWGLAPLYVGQELIGPGSHHTDGAHGAVDGKDAAQFMSDEGFASGSAVYLDLENGLPFPQKQKDYVKNWCGAVQQAGFTSGVYCSHTFAAQVATLVPAALIWAFKVPTTKPHKVPGPHYPDPSPAGSGYPSAFVWQLDQDCLIDVPGVPGRHAGSGSGFGFDAESIDPAHEFRPRSSKGQSLVPKSRFGWSCGNHAFRRANKRSGSSGPTPQAQEIQLTFARATSRVTTAVAPPYSIASSSSIMRSITERPIFQKPGSRASSPNGASSSE